MKSLRTITSSPLARWPRMAATGLLVVVGLVGCGQPTATSEEAAAQVAALAAVDDAFFGASQTDTADIATASVLATYSALGSEGSGAFSTAASEPLLMIRRTDMSRERDLLSLVYDGLSEPATATAEIGITVKGTAQIWQVYPDLSLPRSLVGSKPIEMEGVLTLHLARTDGTWHLTGAESTGLKQGVNAATVEDVTLKPQVLQSGTNDNLAYITLTEPTSSDDFIVAVRSRHLRPHGLLTDDGVAPDAIAEDDVYSGNVWVGEDARSGMHLAFVTALNYARTTDLTMVDGEYQDPYTDTVQGVLVVVATDE
ncbi:MAG: hypothetical protein KF875_12045 [Trueperaceae bacterium]|nr:hypothetical protein [Trueperaceae bacterium]MCW5818482.1 hypothetical protein [Trueperaceae bacterium]